MQSAMVRVRMADGTEYGPITSAVLDQWYQEGRIPPNAVLVDEATGQLRPAFPAQPSAVPPPPPPPVFAASVPMPMANPQGATDQNSVLLHAARCWQARQQMRAIYIASFIWAAINIGVGVMNISNGSGVGGVQIFFGILLLVDAICIASTMAPGMMIFDGIIFLLLALWNLIVGLLSLAAGSPAFVPLLFGGFQVFWSVRDFMRYGEYTRLFAQQASPELANQLQQQLQRLKSVSSKQAADIIEFETSTATKYLKWKGQFDGENAVLMANGGEIVQVLPRACFFITPGNKAVMSSMLKADFVLGNNRYGGKIHPDLYNRYVAWRDSVAVPAS